MSRKKDAKHEKALAAAGLNKCAAGFHAECLHEVACQEPWATAGDTAPYPGAPTFKIWRCGCSCQRGRVGFQP